MSWQDHSTAPQPHRRRAPIGSPGDPLDPLGRPCCADGSNGVFARTAAFEDVIEGLSRLIHAHREADTEVVRFPPVMNRRVRGEVGLSAQLSESARLRVRPPWRRGRDPRRSRPLQCRAGMDRCGEGDRSRAYARRLLSALSAGGRARRRCLRTGLKFDVESYCFRREATFEVDRLQAFRMREYVCMGTPAEAAAFRARWIDACAGNRGQARAAAPHRAGERSVLRPRRADRSRRARSSRC